jgi:hypothetical protein
LIAPAVGAAGDAGCAVITIFADGADKQPDELVSVKLCVPAGSPEIIADIPAPVNETLSGYRVSIHVPVTGNPLSPTLPVANAQAGCVIVPIFGSEGIEFTVSIKVVVAAAHGTPNGLSVVNVISTIFPASPVAGVYVNVNGDVLNIAGLTEPSPFSVIVTLVALPPKVFPVTIKGAVPQVLLLVLLSVTTGPSTHPHDTLKVIPVEVHPETFLTVII